MLKLTMLLSMALAAHAQIDPTIPLRVKPVQIQDPMEAYRRAQEIRSLQLQNEQIRLQNEEIIRARNAAQQPIPAPPASSDKLQQQNPSGTGDLTTHGMLNCRAWKGSGDALRIVYVTAGMEMLLRVLMDTERDQEAVKASFGKYMPYDLKVEEMRDGTTQICAQPENAMIPVVDALKLLSLKTRGSSPSELEEALATSRKASSK
jgi:hypothetical protein